MRECDQTKKVIELLKFYVEPKLSQNVIKLMVIYIFAESMK